MQSNCPCGSSKHFENCCQPIINGKKDAVTAQELMQSRYVAFTLANVDYLMRSHHSSTRPTKERKSIEKWAKSVIWVKLTVLNTQKGEAKDETGFVEFEAVYMENGQLDKIHENSLFQREDNKWVYVSGVFK